MSHDKSTFLTYQFFSPFFFYIAFGLIYVPNSILYSFVVAFCSCFTTLFEGATSIFIPLLPMNDVYDFFGLGMGGLVCLGLSLSMALKGLVTRNVHSGVRS